MGRHPSYTKVGMSGCGAGCGAVVVGRCVPNVWGKVPVGHPAAGFGWGWGNGQRLGWAGAWGGRAGRWGRPWAWSQGWGSRWALCGLGLGGRGRWQTQECGAGRWWGAGGAGRAGGGGVGRGTSRQAGQGGGTGVGRCGRGGGALGLGKGHGLQGRQGTCVTVFNQPVGMGGEGMPGGGGQGGWQLVGS